MILLLEYTIVYASVLILVALGGCFSERSGVVNIGLEGIMVMGALGGVLGLNIASGLPSILILILSMLMAMGAGVLYSLLLAVACIHFKADQTLIGTALNILVIAVATLLAESYNVSINPDNPTSTIYYVNSRMSLFINNNGDNPNILVLVTIVIIFAAGFVLYKTRFGMRLRAVGEHPQAAASVGIDVYKIRYLGVMISGLLGGLGGFAYVTASVGVWDFRYGVAGFGFLALGVLIFGQWNPYKIAASAILFGCCRALSIVYSGIDFLDKLSIDSTIYKMFPYVISLIVLVFTSKKSKAPKAAGIPYDRDAA